MRSLLVLALFASVAAPRGRRPPATAGNMLPPMQNRGVNDWPTLMGFDLNDEFAMALELYHGEKER